MRGVAAYNADLARPWLAEAVGLARAVGDKWRLAEVLAWQAYVGFAGEGDLARPARRARRHEASPTRLVMHSFHVHVAGRWPRRISGRATSRQRSACRAR